MANTVKKDFLITLRWIKSGEQMPNHYNVVFSLKNPYDSSLCYYVYFAFSSFDLLYVYLKSLAKSFRVSSIDRLFSEEFHAKVEYEVPFNSPPIFKCLYINDDTTWPNKNIPGHFLLDSDC